MRKKHRRLVAELESHEPNIQQVQEQANKLLNESKIGKIGTEIETHQAQLDSNWQRLRDLTNERTQKLDQSLAYQNWFAAIDEELLWINEKQRLTSSSKRGTTLPAAQSLIKEHDAFETDFNVHKERLLDLVKQGDALIEGNNHFGAEIKRKLNESSEAIEKLSENAKARKQKLQENWEMLQFLWKSDVVENWIADKQIQLKSDDCGHNLSSVQNLLAKHETFTSGLYAFESEGIKSIIKIKDKLAASGTGSAEEAAEINKKYNQVIDKWQALLAANDSRKSQLKVAEGKFRDIEELYLTFAKKASTFNSWFENAEEDLTDPVRCNSIDEIHELSKAHHRFIGTLENAKVEFNELQELDQKIRNLQMGPNPYTWFTMDTLRDTWRSLQKAIKDRETDLENELKRQKENDDLRKLFAESATEFYSWLTNTRNEMMEIGSVINSLEEQLAATKRKCEEINNIRPKFKKIEDLSSRLEERLVLDNKHTEHSTLSLAQACDQLNQLGMRMIHNLEQQIQARNQSGVTEQSLREFSMMFRHFDKNKTGELDYDQFKSCLRALGYDLPVVEPGEQDVIFENILKVVDPNKSGSVNLQDYMAFMISKETENISSVDDVINAFKALTENGDRPYITRDELTSVCVFFSFYFITFQIENETNFYFRTCNLTKWSTA